MEIKYNKLFDLMKQNQMKQKDLIRATEMSSSLTDINRSLNAYMQSISLWYWRYLWNKVRGVT